MLSKILKNSTWLVGGKVISDGLSFLFYIYLARAFGEEGIGNYSFAFAAAALFGIGVEFGLRTLITRDIAKNSPFIAKYRSNIILFQLFLFFLLGLLLFVVAKTSNYSSQIQILSAYAYLGIALRAIGMTFIGFLEAVDEMGKSSLLEIISKAVIVVIGSALIYSKSSLEAVMFVHVVSGIVYVLLSAYFVKTLFGPIVFDLDFKFIKRTAITALPFIGASVLYILYSRVDYLMIHYFIGEKATGAYSVSFRIIESSLLVASMVGVAIFPSLSRSDANNVQSRDRLFLLALKWLAILGMIGSLPLMIVGDKLIIFLYGDEFAYSGYLMQWMSILLFIGCIKVPYWRLLFAINQEGTQLKIQAISVLINLILNYFLIPIHGVMGAIFASVVSEIYLLIEFHRSCSKIIHIKYIKKSLKFLLISVIVAAIGLFAKVYVFWPFVMFLSVVLFGISILFLGIISKKEKEQSLIILGKLINLKSKIV